MACLHVVAARRGEGPRRFLNPQRGAARGRQFVSAKAVDAHLRYLQRDGVTKDKGRSIRQPRCRGWP